LCLPSACLWEFFFTKAAPIEHPNFVPSHLWVILDGREREISFTWLCHEELFFCSIFESTSSIDIDGMNGAQTKCTWNIGWWPNFPKLGVSTAPGLCLCVASFIPLPCSEQCTSPHKNNNKMGPFGRTEAQLKMRWERLRMEVGTKQHNLY
jgi:hypothetical protein